MLTHKVNWRCHRPNSVFGSHPARLEVLGPTVIMASRNPHQAIWQNGAAVPLVRRPAAALRQSIRISSPTPLLAGIRTSVFAQRVLCRLADCKNACLGGGKLAHEVSNDLTRLFNPARIEGAGCWPISWLTCSLACRFDSEHFSHSHQVYERSGSHLFHHMSAMDFHGNFADLQPVGNLLVHQTRNDKGQDFPFAPG